MQSSHENLVSWHCHVSCVFNSVCVSVIQKVMHRFWWKLLWIDLDRTESGNCGCCPWAFCFGEYMHEYMIHTIACVAVLVIYGFAPSVVESIVKDNWQWQKYWENAAKRLKIEGVCAFLSPQNGHVSSCLFGTEIVYSEYSSFFWKNVLVGACHARACRQGERCINSSRSLL